MTENSILLYIGTDYYAHQAQAYCASEGSTKMQVTMKDFRNMSNEDQQRYIKVAKILITGAVRVAAKEAKENCTPDEDCGSGSTPDLQ